MAALVLVACSSNGGTMVGTVVAVDGGLEEVASFTLLVEGDQLTFVPTPAGEYDFPLSHLRQHLIDGTPVRVGWMRDGDQLVAISLADA